MWPIQPETLDFVAECQRALAEEKPVQAPGSYWCKLRAEPRPAPALYRQFARLATLYIGETPRLSDIALDYSFANNDDRPMHTQTWHRDFDSNRIFRVMIYCNDLLDEDGGPFHVAERDAINLKYRTFPWSTKRVSDHDFAKACDMDRTHSVTGPVGTTFIGDTRHCFHYGGRCKRPRLAYFMTFAPGVGLYPSRSL
jgi:hypothetical protein